MNYGRWATVLLLALSMGIAVSILLVPGERYQNLTTSDSGWNYDVAVIIDNTSALADNLPLSHAPYGMKVEPQQLQPLTTVMVYRAVHAINPSVTLMDVVKYWSPIVFAIALIPIFLVGRELGGNIAGCTAAFLAATMVSSIYWNKVGAFDREAMYTLFAALTMFFMIKLFKATRQDIPFKQGKKYTLLKIGNHALVFEPWRIRARLASYQDTLKFALLAGLSGGLFSLAWSGWLYAMAAVVLGILLVLLLGFVGGLFQKKFDILASVSSAIKSHLHIIIGVLGMAVVATVALWALAAVEPVSMWVGFGQTLLGYVGVNIGGGGVSAGSYASEAQPAGSFGDTFGKFYGADILTFAVMALLALGLLKLLWTRRRWELLTLGWFIILLAMVWPDKGVARYERLWWPLLPVLAGVGIATLTSLIKKFSAESSGEWTKWVYHPLLPVLVVVLVCSALTTNAVTNPSYGAILTTPPTEWHGVRLDNGLMQAFDWIHANATLENITSIQWSYGHVFTGMTQRPGVTDGSESPALEGTWEQSGEVRPPDYIISGGDMYGVNTLRVARDTNGEPKINGRRVDVEWFPLVGMEELKWYLKTYRDSYGCKIDYLIFSADEFWDAYYLDQEFSATTGKIRMGNYIWDDSRMLTTPTKLSPSDGGNNKRVFDFGVVNSKDRSAVVLDPATNAVYLQTDNEQLSLDGCAVFYVNNDGRFTSFNFTPSSSAPAINEVLALALTEEGELVSAWLANGTYGEIARTSERMGVRVFSTGAGSIGGDNSLEVVFTSTDGSVKIIKVNHQFIL